MRTVPALLAALLAGVVFAEEPYDLLIRDGRIVDGTGNPWFEGDVAVRGDRIVAVGRSIDGEARRAIDASGLSFRDILVREGFELPVEIEPSERPLAGTDERTKDVGYVIMATAALSLSIGAASSMVILALSRFLKAREHAPALVESYKERTKVAANGSATKTLERDQVFRQPHTAKTAQDIEAKINLVDGAVFRLSTRESDKP